MNALNIMKVLVKNSTDMEKIGMLSVPESGVKDFFTNMFGEGIIEYRGAARPGCNYLFTYGDELGSIFDVLLFTADKQTIAMVRVD